MTKLQVGLGPNVFTHTIFPLKENQSAKLLEKPYGLYI